MVIAVVLVNITQMRVMQEVNQSTLNRKLFPLRNIGTTLIRRAYITIVEVILAMGTK